MALNPKIVGVTAMRPKKDSVWSEWQQPVLHPRRYTLFCCDCALCHQLQFKVVTTKRGTQLVRYRVKRADRYTQAKRKHKAERGHIELLKKGEKVVALIDNVMVITLENGLRRTKKRKVERRKRRKHRGR